MTRLISTLLVILFTTQLFSQPAPSIYGTVIDDASTRPMPLATVVVIGSDPIIGTTTDMKGHFIIADLPVGRYNLQADFLGYEPSVVYEVVVSSAKQAQVTIRMKESVMKLGEVVVTPTVNKAKPLNAMATVSAKMLSVEEASRYAGGFDDPARLASSVAGVASNTSENGIIVRGNAPKFLQWRLEGVEIPNPNHFADLNSLGGGTLTALSSQVLANSDFLTGAFPAEYNNALSGVFDLKMRTGNNQEHEHTFQLGLLGIDVSSEGPLTRGGRSSYLFNYRYSTLALAAPLLPDGAGSIEYQDLSFKLNFPSTKSGIFTLWGLGMIDGASNDAKTAAAERLYTDDKQTDVIKQRMGAAGLSHKYFFADRAYLKTTLATTMINTDWSTKRLDQEQQLQPASNIYNTNTRLVLSSVFNKKFNATHTNRTGILLTGMMYDIFSNNALTLGDPPLEIFDADGFSGVVSGYSSSSLNLARNLSMNIGINGQYFLLNKQSTLEPRLGLRQQITDNHSVGFGYGLHSRLEKLNYYFNNSTATGEEAVNKDLDFSKAHHMVISYDWNISDLVHLKVEPYYQWLFSIPIIPDSSFSFINLHNDLFFGAKLENTGVGENYGLDVTLEKYVSNGYYYLATASIFKSRYKGGDGAWHNTRFNRNYVFNFLIGKEWLAGKREQNIFSLNGRIGYQGGNRYSPVNEAASHLLEEVVYDETKAFSLQADPTLNVHFTASYKMNKEKSSHELALKVLNVTGTPDFNGFQYNHVAHTIDEDRASTVIPNLSYKIQF
jgi:hypothetical protein